METIFLLVMSFVFFVLSFFIAVKNNAEGKIHLVLMFICLIMSILLFFFAAGGMLVVD